MRPRRCCPPHLAFYVFLLALLTVPLAPCSADAPNIAPDRDNRCERPAATLEPNSCPASLGAEVRGAKPAPVNDAKPRTPEFLPTDASHSARDKSLAQAPPTRPAFVPGQVVVGMTNQLSAKEHTSLFATHGAYVLQVQAHCHAYVLAVPKGEEQSTAERLASEAGVSFAEPAYLYYADYAPNDPQYATDQWHYPIIQMPNAWDLTTGSISVIVAVLDTGLDLTHPDAPVNIAPGYDTVNVDSDPSDDDGHGTHVAGTIAANTNNGIGVAGIASGTTLMPVKVLGPDGGTNAQVADGIHWAVDHGADIINMSLGSSYPSQLVEDACTYAYNNGVAIVAAAGNDYQYGSPVHYPSAYDHVLAVAATGDRDEHAAYSTAGYFVDIAAPGGNPASGNDYVWSTVWRGTGASYNGYAGTSMAAPHVAGVLALLMHLNPSMTVDQLYDRVCSTALDLGATGRDDLYGWGRIDAYAALTNTDPSPGPEPLGADDYEPDDSAAQASTMALNTTQEDHSIHFEGDQDWVQFTVPTGQNVTIETSGPTGASDDTQIALYDATGSTWIDGDDDGGTGYYSRLSLYLDAGTYALQVWRYANRATIDSYHITLTGGSVAIPEDAYEPDDFESQCPNPVPLDAYQTGRTLHTPTDIDRAQFVVSESIQVIIETEGYGTSDTVIALYDEGWTTQLGWDDDSGEANFSRLEAQLEPGTYSVIIWEDGQDATIGLYSLSITGESTVEEIPQDDYEPDDSPTMASWMAINGIQREHSLHEPDDQDWIKFTLDQDAEITIETSGPVGASDDTVLELWDELGTIRLGYDDDSGAGYFSRLVVDLDAGTYAILVRSYGYYEAIASYDVSLTAAPVADAYEPDDSLAEASAMLGAGHPEHSIHTAGDHDWITFDVTHACWATIETSGPSYADTVMRLWNHDGSELLDEDDDGGENLFSRIVIPLQPGSYAIEIWEYADNGTIGEYAVAIDYSLGEDAFEPNDTRAQATPLSAGVDQSHALYRPGDLDWVTFEIPQYDSPDELHAVTLETAGTEGNTVLYLCDALGNALASDDDSGEGQFSRIALSCDEGLEPGTYLAKVASHPYEDVQRQLVPAYTIRFTYSACAGGSGPEPVQGPGSPWVRNYGTVAGGWTDYETYPRWSADVNGDGRDDIVAFGNRATYVSLSTGASFGPPTAWIAMYGPNAGGWVDYNTYPRLLGDVNGDGRDDIVAFGNRATYVSLSTGASFASPTAWIALYGPGAGSWMSQDLHPRMLGDVNGDGLDDVVAFGNAATYVSLSTGSSFGSPQAWIACYGPGAGGWASYDTFPRMVDDVNGDGLDDIVAFGNKATYVSLSTGSSFGPPTPWARGYGPDSGGWLTQDGQTRLVGDVDGDSKADIMVFGGSETNLWRSTTQEQGLFSWFFTNDHGWASQNVYPRDLGDVDGDGKLDIIGFGSDGTYVQLAP